MRSVLRLYFRKPTKGEIKCEFGSGPKRKQIWTSTLLHPLYIYIFFIFRNDLATPFIISNHPLKIILRQVCTSMCFRQTLQLDWSSDNNPLPKWCRRFSIITKGWFSLGVGIEEYGDLQVVIWVFKCNNRQTQREVGLLVTGTEKFMIDPFSNMPQSLGL